jgi:hypothetical protein
MAVYVDDMNASFGRMKMSHMLADTDEELHAMAARIGVARKWHQAPPRHDSHYDIALSKKALAVAAGAVEITLRQAGSMNFRRRVTGQLGTPEGSEQWMSEWKAKARATAAASPDTSSASSPSSS